MPSSGFVKPDIHWRASSAIIINMDNALKARLYEFFALSKDEISRGFDPVLNTKYPRLRGDPSEVSGFLHWCDRMAKYCDSRGGYMLDAGCGFGIPAFGFLVSKHAPAKIVALDTSEGKIRVLKMIAGFLAIEPGRIEPVCASGTMLPFDAVSFDSVFVKDVASHVSDRKKFFSEIARVLKPGGKFLLTDENNSLEIFGRAARRKLWLQAELGPIPDQSWMKETYSDSRRRLIAEWRPDLNTDTIDYLVKASIGMYGEDFRHSIKVFAEGDTYKNTSDFPYRHPVTGEYMEYPFNPFDLTREIEKYSFRARYVPPVFPTGNRAKIFAGRIISALHPYTAILQPNIYILAVKK